MNRRLLLMQVLECRSLMAADGWWSWSDEDWIGNSTDWDPAVADDDLTAREVYASFAGRNHFESEPALGQDNALWSETFASTQQSQTDLWELDATTAFEMAPVDSDWGWLDGDRYGWVREDSYDRYLGFDPLESAGHARVADSVWLDDGGMLDCFGDGWNDSDAFWATGFENPVVAGLDSGASTGLSLSSSGSKPSVANTNYPLATPASSSLSNQVVGAVQDTAMRSTLSDSTSPSSGDRQPLVTLTTVTHIVVSSPQSIRADSHEQDSSATRDTGLSHSIGVSTNTANLQSNEPGNRSPAATRAANSNGLNPSAEGAVTDGIDALAAPSTSATPTDRGVGEIANLPSNSPGEPMTDERSTSSVGSQKIDVEAMLRLSDSDSNPDKQRRSNDALDSRDRDVLNLWAEALFSRKGRPDGDDNSDMALKDAEHESDEISIRHDRHRNPELRFDAQSHEDGASALALSVQSDHPTPDGMIAISIHSESSAPVVRHASIDPMALVQLFVNDDLAGSITEDDLLSPADAAESAAAAVGPVIHDSAYGIGKTPRIAAIISIAFGWVAVSAAKRQRGEPNSSASRLASIKRSLDKSWSPRWW